MTKGIVYYTDNRLDAVLAEACWDQLNRATAPIGFDNYPEKTAEGLWFVAVSLKPLESYVIDEYCITVDGEPGHLTMFRQILAGLEALDTDIAFLCEHDVLYHPSHFAFMPPRADTFYYNRNVWKVRASDGHALHYPCDQVSGLCANRELLIEHYRKRVARVEAEGFSLKMGYEPGTHTRTERVDDYGSASWMSEYPNIDIRHDRNLSPSRWKKEEFRNQKHTEGWTESDRVPGWGVTKGRFREFIADVNCREAMA